MLQKIKERFDLPDDWLNRRLAQYVNVKVALCGVLADYGKSSSEIGDIIGLDRSTVSTHIRTYHQNPKYYTKFASYIDSLMSGETMFEQFEKIDFLSQIEQEDGVSLHRHTTGKYHRTEEGVEIVFTTLTVLLKKDGTYIIENHE